eukprot:TRINITY_DN4342_c0_g1_i2.p1 TRINITY_DN4342_c0_g1~~TRINITY_DN4342_c0_g1_i2.p1  ORF type:complete len:287 (-),score=64.32 TRINITY_DN4342_c0_g1_i2:69-929(-)
MDLVMQASTKYNIFPPWIFKIYQPPSFVNSINALDNLRSIVDGIILERKNKKKEIQSEYNDLLSMLLSYTDVNNELLSLEDISFTCWDMFIAGHETTGHTMSWCLYELAKNPEIQMKVQEEIDSVFQDEQDIDFPTLKCINKLIFCHNTLKETLRLHPTVPIFSRLSSQTEIIRNYKLKPFTPVLINNYHLHRHPDYWEEPLSFLPDRWDKFDKDDIPPYYPFGYGPRSCVGKKMALVEAKIVLVQLMKHYTVKLPVGIIDSIEEDTNITMRPFNLKIELTVRERW